MIQYKYDEKDIEKKRRYIFEKLIKLSKNIKSGTIKEISTADIKILFELYDEVFLNNQLRDEFKGKFVFSLSKRMTKSAGMTLCPKNIGTMKPEEVVIEFRIGVDFFFQYDLLKGVKSVGGIETQNALAALQLVLEHEICHAIEFIYFFQSSCKGNRFKRIARDLFGHKNSYHQLPTNKVVAREKLGLHIGDTVSFISKDQIVNGFIQRINKRATIMVQDKKGQYADKEGNRYTKYYVPLHQIKRVL